ncbi:MAG: hypothetical protein IT303_14085 [Dehalococcoidia bacterium]|nr:hypothetical protein [Dehalococcoidia bacterium]
MSSEPRDDRSAASVYPMGEDFSRVFRASRLRAAALGPTHFGIDDIIWALQVIPIAARSLLIELGATMPGELPPAFTPELLEAFHGVVLGEEMQPLLFGNPARLDGGPIDALFLVEWLIETGNTGFAALLEAAGIEAQALIARIQELRAR